MWTGTWRDPRFSPPADGGRPENALTGQLFMVNDGDTTAIHGARPPTARLRFWRNTTVATLAAGATATLPHGTLGYEWDEDVDNGFRPTGLVQLSLDDAQRQRHAARLRIDLRAGHRHPQALTLYRHPSGALVFGAGTVQWSWGLDASHDRGTLAADVRMQQATVNLFADMGAQPDTLQSGLVAATASTDPAAPTSTITAPAERRQRVPPASRSPSRGTATDAGGGLVGGVEVSTNGGDDLAARERPRRWTFCLDASGTGPATRSAAARSTTAATWRAPGRRDRHRGQRQQHLPVQHLGPDGDAGEARRDDDPCRSRSARVPLRRRPGGITGIRFYKGSTNTGTHVGHLWSRHRHAARDRDVHERDRERLAGGPLRHARSTITADTTYVASYHAPRGNYAGNVDYFTLAGVDNGPLRALADGEDAGGNGVYAYGAQRQLPERDLALGELLGRRRVRERRRRARHDAAHDHRRDAGARRDERRDRRERTAQFSEAMTATTVNTTSVALTDAARRGRPRRASATTRARAPRRSTRPPRSPAAPPTASPSRAAAPGSRTWRATRSRPTTPGRSPRAPLPSSGCPCSIWPGTAVPQKAAETTDNAAVEIGTRFRCRHGRLRDRDPLLQGGDRTPARTPATCGRTPAQLLATATFTGESASGLAGGEPRRAGRDHGEHASTWSPTTRRTATTRRPTSSS